MPRTLSQVKKTSPNAHHWKGKKTARSHQTGKTIKVECQECYEEFGSESCLRPAHRKAKRQTFDPNSGMPNPPELIPDVEIVADAQGVISQATITVNIPALRNLSAKKLVEHLKAAVELEVELLKETL